MDHEKTYIVAQQVEEKFPESFLLEFRFFTNHGSDKRPNILPEGKVFPKFLRIALSHKISDIRKRLFKMMKPACELGDLSEDEFVQ